MPQEAKDDYENKASLDGARHDIVTLAQRLTQNMQAMRKMDAAFKSRVNRYFSQQMPVMVVNSNVDGGVDPKFFAYLEKRKEELMTDIFIA